MKRFTRVLSEARDQLEISEPARSRVLLEMASDLEDSYEFHLSQGCDEAEATRRARVSVVLPTNRPLEPGKEKLMERTTILVGLAIGVCAFALTWATVRHFTGLAQEQSLALAIAVVVGVFVGVGYAVVESRLFELWLRRRR